MLHKLKVIKKDYLIINMYGEFVEGCFHKVHYPRNFLQDIPKNVMYEK
jgi:hypothetical protein